MRRSPASARCWWWACSSSPFSLRTSSFPPGRWRRRCWSAIIWWWTASRSRRPTKWMPLVHYREPRRGDIVVFIKPVPNRPDADGKPQYLFLVKRLIGVPGDHIHLRNGIVIINGVAQSAAARGADHAGELSRLSRRISFRSAYPTPDWARPKRWAVDFPNHIAERRSGCAAGQVLHDGRQPARQPRLALLGLCAARKHHRPAAVQLLVVRDSRHQITNRRASAIPWPGWAMWRCTSLPRRAGSGRCTLYARRQLSVVSLQLSVSKLRPLGTVY